MQMHSLTTDVLETGDNEAGPAGGPAVLLRHGFPHGGGLPSQQQALATIKASLANPDFAEIVHPRNVHFFPALRQRRLLPGIGHSPHQEAPEIVAEVLLDRSSSWDGSAEAGNAP